KKRARNEEVPRSRASVSGASAASRETKGIPKCSNAVLVANAPGSISVGALVFCYHRMDDRLIRLKGREMTPISAPIQVRGACPHDCPDTCAVITEVQDGRAIKFYADKNHPITQGWLCAKVRSYLDRVYHPDRLMYPLRRVGPKGSGDWKRIS